MTVIMRIYKTVIILISVATVITMLWIYINKGVEKSPTRGVFVFEDHCVFQKSYH